MKEKWKGRRKRGKKRKRERVRESGGRESRSEPIAVVPVKAAGPWAKAEAIGLRERKKM